MQLLSLNFLILSFGGVWRPLGWSSTGTKVLYNLFTFVTLIMIYFLSITQILDVVLVVDNIEDFVISALMFGVIAVCSKGTTVIVCRKAIIGLTETLLNEPYKPQNEDEREIQKKFDVFIRSFSMKYLVLAMFSLTGVTTRSVMNIMRRQLPYRVWLPYDITISLLFYITSMQQIIAVALSTLINVGAETLVFGLFLQTCALLEMFENRLQKLVTSKAAKHLKSARASPNKEKSEISDYIRHHINIYKYAKRVNIIFNQALFVQFFDSIIILCTNVYYLAAHATELESMTWIICAICMVLQIYIYCWSANEVMIKSTSIGDAIYHMDWYLLSVSERKDFWMIMKRSTIPIKFTSSFLITLSLESFSNILRASYSAFNVLQK